MKSLSSPYSMLTNSSPSFGSLAVSTTCLRSAIAGYKPIGYNHGQLRLGGNYALDRGIPHKERSLRR
jgi:hypothetical protein